MKRIASALLCASLLTSLAPARAQDGEPVGLDLELSFHSAYVWRGLNLFADSDATGTIDQNDLNTMLSPAVGFAVPGTSFALGYVGAYQLNGDNKSALVDAGLGAEQDLLLFWDGELAESTTLSAGFTYYFYPFASEEMAGTSFPHYLEPSATLVQGLGPLGLGLAVAYFHGIPAALESTRHLYLNPHVSHATGVNDAVAIEATAGVGYKVWTGERQGDTDNTYDVLVGLSAPMAIGDPFTVTPTLSWAWTNFEHNGFADEQVLFGSLAVGAGL